MIFHFSLNLFLRMWFKGGETWVLNSNEDSLAFMMANAGYDVWIGNTRSSNYTFGHLTHTRKDKVNNSWTLSGPRTLFSFLQHLSYLLLFVHEKKKDWIIFLELLVLQEFWNWNWDNLVKTDLPTMLQHVYDSSNQKIYYVGCSQVCFQSLEYPVFSEIRLKVKSNASTSMS